MPTRAKIYISIVLALGAASLIVPLVVLAQLQSADPWIFWAYFVLTVCTSGLKVRLPMVFATLSVNFLFILVGIVYFTLPQAVVLGAAGTIVQCLWRAHLRPKLVQIAFSTSSICLAAFAAHAAFHGPLGNVLGVLHPLRIGVAAFAYYIVNTGLIAGVIALTGGKSIYRTWYDNYFWVL